MACNGCEERARVRALGHLTAAERREYLQAIQLAKGEDSSKLLALGHHRIKADIRICQRCSDLLGSESLTDFRWESNYKFRNILLCGNCVGEIESSHGAFCASCLRLIRDILRAGIESGAGSKYISLPGGIYGGRFMICGECCYPEAPRQADQIPEFLGGKHFVPELLRPSNSSRDGLGLGLSNDAEENQHEL